MASVRADPAGAGYPLFLVDAQGAVVRAFGSDGYYDARNRNALERFVAVLPDGHLAVVHRRQWVVEVFDTAGKQLRRWAATRPWFANAEISDKRLADYRPAPLLWQVSPMTTTRVLTLGWAPDRRWESALRREADRVRIADRTRYTDSVLEVVDLSTGAVLASRRFDIPFAGFIRPGLLWSPHEQPDGELELLFWRVSIQSCQ
ncbi:MAG: hypothetical protein ACOY71_10790 [Gemmatimonadota bacterium]